MSTELEPKRAYREPASVNASSTSLVVLVVREYDCVAVTFKNADELQTVDVYLNTRSHPLDDLAPRLQPAEFQAIPAGETRTVDVKLGTELELEVVAVASGAGCLGTLTVIAGGRR